MLFPKLVAGLSFASVAIAAVSWIVPGTTWTDTSGKRIDAHGGMVWKVGSTFYWIGQSNGNGVTPIIYTSTDLLNWQNRGLQLSSVTGMYRPKMLLTNGKYFWHVQILGQVNRLVQGLSSKTILGGYAKAGAAQTLPPSAKTYSDEGLFQDTDGTWYLLTSADSNALQINIINTDGTVGDRVSQLGGSIEAPGLFKAGGVYFLIASAKTGYRSNPNKVYTSTSVKGPWSAGTDIAPESTNTYNSQNTFELTISGSKTTTYVYMGDQWDQTTLANSNYVWLPMTVDTKAKTVTLVDHAMWKVDPSTGVVSVPSTGKRYEAEDAIITGRAAIANCEACISKRSVHKVDPSSSIIFENVKGTGSPQWVTFHYTVNKPLSGEAHIFINDNHAHMNLSDFNSRAGYHHAVPVELNLKSGAVNNIEVGCTGDKDFEMHFDGIEVHED